MAKFYGRYGVKIGTEGNETYVVVKGVNIVKAKIIHTQDTITINKIKARARYSSALKLYKIYKPYANGLFEYVKSNDNARNRFFSLNCSQQPLITRDTFRNYSLPLVSHYYASYGSLGSLSLGYASPDSRYHGLTVSISDHQGGNTTIGDLSTALINTYPFIKNNYKLSFFGIAYDKILPNQQQDRFINPFINEGNTNNYVQILSTSFKINISNQHPISDVNLTLSPITGGKSTICYLDTNNNDSISNVNNIDYPYISFFSFAVSSTLNDNIISTTNRFFLPTPSILAFETLSSPEYEQNVIDSWTSYYKSRGKTFM